MKHTLPVLAALALGLAAPASAQEEIAPPPPDAEPAEAIEEAAPPPASDAEPGAGPRRERPRRPGAGPRRDGPGGAGGHGPRHGGPGGAGGPGRGAFGMRDQGGSLGFLAPLLKNPEAAAKIGLTEEQSQALAATIADLDAQLAAVHDKLPAAFEKQARLLEADPVDEAAILAAVNEAWDLRREVALLQTRKVIAIRAALGPEQIEKARALLKEEFGRFGERGGPGGGMRRGPGERGPGGRRGPKGGPAAEGAAEAAE